MAPSRLETVMAGSGADALARNLFRDDVVYTPLGGTARTIGAQLVVERDETLAEELGETREQRARLVARRHATLGVDTVLRGSTVATDGTTWVVVAGEAGLDGLMRLDLQRKTGVERAPGGWRAT